MNSQDRLLRGATAVVVTLVIDAGVALAAPGIGDGDRHGGTGGQDGGGALGCGDGRGDG